MKSLRLTGALAACGLLATGAAFAVAAVGQPAPAFTATDVSGKTVSLADFKGRHVVLEWVNPGCPFVVKHYSSANMQGTQKEATAKGVVWLAVSSTAPDASDYRKPADLAQWMKGQKAAATTTLMDDDGKVGKAYGARTTPHMYIVDPAGTLVYAGGIDSKPSSNVADIATATNHVQVALAETLAGKPVSQASTRPYGCSVKYSSL
ncbi:MAG: thioredoxin family protein [Leptothrix sp. (in: Bacteria)]|nr:thioredoxin family protein [Leptothrix sp. (in: b-proteobacteria)]